MKMRCNSVQRELSAYLDGELSAGRAVAIEKHISACPACSLLMERLSETISLVSSLEPICAPEGFADRVQKGIDRHLADRRLGRRLFHPLHIKIPLEALAAAAVAALVLMHPSYRERRAGPPLSEPGPRTPDTAAFEHSRKQPGPPEPDTAGRWEEAREKPGSGPGRAIDRAADLRTGESSRDTHDDSLMARKETGGWEKKDGPGATAPRRTGGERMKRASGRTRGTVTGPSPSKTDAYKSPGSPVSRRGRSGAVPSQSRVQAAQAPAHLVSVRNLELVMADTPDNNARFVEFNSDWGAWAALERPGATPQEQLEQEEGHQQLMDLEANALVLREDTARKNTRAVGTAHGEAAAHEAGNLVYNFTIMLDDYPVFVRALSAIGSIYSTETAALVNILPGQELPGLRAAPPPDKEGLKLHAALESDPAREGDEDEGEEQAKKEQAEARQAFISNGLRINVLESSY